LDDIQENQEIKHSEKSTSTVSFRFEAEEVKKLQHEAHNKGISLNSLMRHIIKEYFEWHIFDSTVGFVLLPKPIVREFFTKTDKEDVIQIASTIGKEVLLNNVNFMKGKVDVESFLSWFKVRMKNSSIETSHVFDAGTRIHTYVVKHDICENWSLYLKLLIEHIFSQVLEKKVEVSMSYTTLTFKFKQDY
jgi:hypothetical protein